MKRKEGVHSLHSIRKGEIARSLLKTIGVSGMRVAAISAAALSNALDPFMRPSRGSHSYRRSSLSRSLANLKARGDICFVQTKRGWKIELTETGAARLHRIQLTGKLIKKPKRWDKKWRLLIFDIEEKRKNIRERVRRSLIEFGFYRLQDSVWLFPYDCEEIIELFRTQYTIRHDAIFIRADYLSNDKELRIHFGI